MSFAQHLGMTGCHSTPGMAGLLLSRLLKCHNCCHCLIINLQRGQGETEQLLGLAVPSTELPPAGMSGMVLHGQ